MPSVIVSFHYNLPNHQVAQAKWGSSARENRMNRYLLKSYVRTFPGEWWPMRVHCHWDGTRELNSPEADLRLDNYFPRLTWSQIVISPGWPEVRQHHYHKPNLSQTTHHNKDFAWWTSSLYCASGVRVSKIIPSCLLNPEFSIWSRFKQYSSSLFNSNTYKRLVSANNLSYVTQIYSAPNPFDIGIWCV